MRRTTTALLVPLLLALLGLGACSSDSDISNKSPEEVMSAAKKELDDTSGFDVGLTTKKLPDGVDGILTASGTGTNAPAFQGSLKVSVNSLTVNVPVISVDGAVYAKLPFTTTFTEIDPADYGAPDPANLVDPDIGLGSWLTAATDVKKGEQTREGDKVVTAFTATIPGKTVRATIPSARASGKFDAEFLVDDSGKMVGGAVTGRFYGKGGDVSYDLAISNYGADKDITKP